MQTTSHDMLRLCGVLVLLGLWWGCASEGATIRRESRLHPSITSQEHRADVHNHRKEYRQAEETYALAIAAAVRRSASQRHLDRLIGKWHEAKRTADAQLREQIPVDHVLREAKRRADEGDLETAERILALRLAQDQPQMLPTKARRRLQAERNRYRALARGPVEPAPPVDPRRRGIEIAIGGLLSQDLPAAWVDGQEKSRTLRQQAQDTVREAVAFSSDFGAFLERVHRVGLALRLADYRPGGQRIEPQLVADSLQSHCDGFGLVIELETGQSKLDAAGRLATPDPDHVAASTLLTWTADGQRLQSTDDWTAPVPPHSEVTIAQHLGGRVCGSLVRLLLEQFRRF